MVLSHNIPKEELNFSMHLEMLLIKVIQK